MKSTNKHDFQHKPNSPTSKKDFIEIPIAKSRFIRCDLSQCNLNREKGIKASQPQDTEYPLRTVRYCSRSSFLANHPREDFFVCIYPFRWYTFFVNILHSCGLNVPYLRVLKTCTSFQDLHTLRAISVQSVRFRLNLIIYEIIRTKNSDFH